jgi:hypothetical protein
LFRLDDGTIGFVRNAVDAEISRAIAEAIENCSRSLRKIGIDQGWWVGRGRAGYVRRASASPPIAGIMLHRREPPQWAKSRSGLDHLGFAIGFAT